MKKNIIVYQMDSVFMNVEENLNKVKKAVEEHHDAADFFVIPEFFNTGYHLNEIGDRFYQVAEEIPGPITDYLSDLAKQYEIAIVANIAEKSRSVDSVLYDTSFVIDKSGTLKGKYRKAHVYPDEHKYFKAGNCLDVFEVDGVKVGLATCYDHAFHEPFRVLALKGAELIFIPSAVPKGYEYLLELRTRARAQDNQIFVVAANRSGIDHDIQWCGSSMIVNPKGQMLTKAAEEEVIIKSTIDFDEIRKERMQEPVFRSRRPDLYKSITEEDEA